VKTFKHILKNETVQVLIITTCLYCSAVMSCDFRTSLYPNHFGTANANYINFIRIICCVVIGFALIQVLQHLDDYIAHVICILNNRNRWVFLSSRIVVIALYLKWVLNTLYPYLGGKEIYFVLWLAINAAIVLPMILIITKYKV